MERASAGAHHVKADLTLGSQAGAASAEVCSACPGREVTGCGRRYPVGSQLAGRRLTVRLDRGLLQLVDQGVLLRSLPNPLTPAEQTRLRDARPAGPPPAPAPEPLRVQRRVSRRGALVVAKQRIHVGIVHAGRTLTVEAADTTWRIYDDNGLLAEVARTTTKPITRFKVHKPEPPRGLSFPRSPDTWGEVAGGARKDVVYACPTPCRVPRARGRAGPHRGQTGRDAREGTAHLGVVPA